MSTHYRQEGGQTGGGDTADSTDVRASFTYGGKVPEMFDSYFRTLETECRTRDGEPGLVRSFLMPNTYMEPHAASTPRPEHGGSVSVFRNDTLLNEHILSGRTPEVIVVVPVERNLKPSDERRIHSIMPLINRMVRQTPRSTIDQYAEAESPYGAAGRGARCGGAVGTANVTGASVSAPIAASGDDINDSSPRDVQHTPLQQPTGTEDTKSAPTRRKSRRHRPHIDETGERLIYRSGGRTEVVDLKSYGITVPVTDNMSSDELDTIIRDAITQLRASIAEAEDMEFDVYGTDEDTERIATRHINLRIIIDVVRRMHRRALRKEAETALEDAAGDGDVTARRPINEHISAPMADGETATAPMDDSDRPWEIPSEIDRIAALVGCTIDQSGDLVETINRERSRAMEENAEIETLIGHDVGASMFEYMRQRFRRAINRIRDATLRRGQRHTDAPQPHIYDDDHHLADTFDSGGDDIDDASKDDVDDDDHYDASEYGGDIDDTHSTVTASTSMTDRTDTSSASAMSSWSDVFASRLGSTQTPSPPSTPYATRGTGTRKATRDDAARDLRRIQSTSGPRLEIFDATAGKDIAPWRPVLGGRGDFVGLYRYDGTDATSLGPRRSRRRARAGVALPYTHVIVAKVSAPVVSLQLKDYVRRQCALHDTASLPTLDEFCARDTVLRSAYSLVMRNALRLVAQFATIAGLRIPLEADTEAYVPRSRSVASGPTTLDTVVYPRRARPLHWSYVNTLEPLRFGGKPFVAYFNQCTPNAAFLDKYREVDSVRARAVAPIRQHATGVGTGMNVRAFNRSPHESVMMREFARWFSNVNPVLAGPTRKIMLMCTLQDRQSSDLLHRISKEYLPEYSASIVFPCFTGSRSDTRMHRRRRRKYRRRRRGRRAAIERVRRARGPADGNDGDTTTTTTTTTAQQEEERDDGEQEQQHEEKEDERETPSMSLYGSGGMNFVGNLQPHTQTDATTRDSDDDDDDDDDSDVETDFINDAKYIVPSDTVRRSFTWEGDDGDAKGDNDRIAYTRYENLSNHLEHLRNLGFKQEHNVNHLFTPVAVKISNSV